MKKFHLFLSLFLLLISASAYAQTSIEMEEENGIYKVPCKVNGLKLKFYFDTGASSVSISSAIANMMFENGYLSAEDIIGSGKTQIANGDIIDNTLINIKEIEIAGLTLTDVQAVVIHQQSAPLLLGQSAIQKLGKVSIMGNTLIIDQLSIQNPYKESGKRLDAIELIHELAKAAEHKDNGNYLAAIEIYDRVVKGGYLEEEESDRMVAVTLERYADCLSAIDKDREALNWYMAIEEWMEENEPSKLMLLYMNICNCAYNSKEYNLAIKYGQLCQSKLSFTHSLYTFTVDYIASSYRELGKKYDAQYTYRNYINKYLAFMEISIMDCWHKNFRDETLADMLYSMALSNIDDYEKYQIIAAAWGHSESQEFCNKYDIDYSSKPKQYEYKF